jgi:hypothetical protein
VGESDAALSGDVSPSLPARLGRRKITNIECSRGIRSIFFGVCCWLYLCGPALAIEPEHKLGTWIGATSNLRFSDRWSLFLQGEARTWEPLNNLNEFLWRVSGRYDFNKKYRGEFGYVRVDTWPYEATGLGKFDENRLYQEFLFKQSWGKTKINHRFRLEQRWITTPEMGKKYSNRLRYKLQFKRPLRGDKIVPGTYFVKALNEIFIDLDRNGYWFDLEGFDKGLNQNRLNIGVGRQLTKSSSITLGGLWQHRPNTNFYRVLLGYSHNFDLRSK